MDLKTHFGIIFIYYIVTVEATLYQLFFDNAEVFDNCPKIPGNNGIHDLFDLTEFSIEYNDGSVVGHGNATCVWEGVEPTDRIETRIEVYKYQRGSYNPTPYTIITKNFCASQYDENSVWYQMWSKHIPDEDRKCLNNYGHVYHHNPFETDTVFDTAAPVGGRHKVVYTFEAFDEKQVKRPKTICFEVYGDFTKI